MPIIDQIPPAPTYSTPANNTLNIPLDSAIFVNFSENIKIGAGSITLSNHQGDTRRIAIHDRSQVQSAYLEQTKSGVNPTQLKITPRNRLLSNSTYYVQIEASAVNDLAGNPLTSDYQSQFTTSADNTPPQFIKQSVNNEGNLVLSFNEPLKQGPGQFAVRNQQGVINEWQITPNFSDNSVTFIPNFGAAPQTPYTIQINSEAIADLAGNPVVLANSVNLPASTSAASAGSYIPRLAAGATTSVGTDIMLATDTFAFKIGTGYIYLSNGVGDNRTIAIDDVRQVRWGKAASGYPTLIIDPLENLWPNSQYSVNLDPSALTSLAGTSFIWSTGSEGFSFNTGIIDNAAPIALYGRLTDDPQVTRQHINTKASIVGIFNEYIKAGTGNIILSNGQGDTRTIAVNDTSQISIKEYSLTITPSKKLLPGSQYYVLVDYAALTDQAGNPYVGIQDKTAFTFNTESIWTAASQPVLEINSGKQLGLYEPGDTLVFNFNTPIKDYQYFTLNQHSLGGNDVILSKDGLSATVLLDNSSTVVPGDVLTLTGCQDSQGYRAEVDFKL